MLQPPFSPFAAVVDGPDMFSDSEDISIFVFSEKIYADSIKPKLQNVLTSSSFFPLRSRFMEHITKKY